MGPIAFIVVVFLLPAVAGSVMLAVLTVAAVWRVFGGITFGALSLLGAGAGLLLLRWRAQASGEPGTIEPGWFDAGG